MKNIGASAGAIVLALSLALTLVGCSDATSDRHGRETSTRAASGPWAKQFVELAAAVQGPLAKSILAKGTISDQDYLALRGDYAKCMANHGFHVTFDTNEVPAFSPSRAGLNESSAMAECGKDFEPVAMLREAIRRNPQHLDESRILAECLWRRGLVPKGYTGKDFTRDSEKGTFPFSTDDPIFAECANDPLNVLAKQ